MAARTKKHKDDDTTGLTEGCYNMPLTEHCFRNWFDGRQLSLSLKILHLASRILTIIFSFCLGSGGPRLSAGILYVRTSSKACVENPATPP